MRRRDAAGPGDLLGRWAENPVRHGQRLRVDQRLTVEAERSPLSAGCGEARLVAEVGDDAVDDGDAVRGCDEDAEPEAPHEGLPGNGRGSWGEGGGREG